MSTYPVSKSTETWPAVSVVLPVRNEGGNIDACLASVFAQDYPGEILEVIAVDGESTDDTLEKLRRQAQENPRFRWMKNARKSVSSSLNLALAETRGEIVVRVDGHTVLSPDYVRRCVEALEETGADNVGGPMHPQGTSDIGRAVSRAMQTRFGVGTAPFRFARRRREVDTVYMGAFRRSTLERVGPFDESLLKNQDYEMNYRIRRGGGRVVVDPAIRSTYTTRPTLASLWRQYFGYGYWKSRMIRKNPGSIRARQVAAPLLVVALFFSALLGLVSLLGFGPGPWTLAFPALVGIYLAVSLAFTVKLAAGHGAGLLWALPVVFGVVHLSWGLGFLAGLMSRPDGGIP